MSIRKRQKLTIIFLLFLSFKSPITASAQVAIGTGMIIYHNNYFGETKFPPTIVVEWDQAERLKFISFLSYGHRYVKTVTDPGIWKPYIDYRPIELALSYRYFFEGSADEGFGFFWSLGTTFKINTGKYEMRPPSVYITTGSASPPEFPEELKVPMNYLNISPGYKFDLDPVNINLGLLGEWPFKVFTLPRSLRNQHFSTKLFVTISYSISSGL